MSATEYPRERRRGGFAAVAALFLLAACDGPIDPVVAKRQENRREAERTTLALKADLDRGAPAEIAAERARRLIALQREFVELFPFGSVNGSRALPSVWSDRAGFERASDAAIRAAERMATVIAGGTGGPALEALYDYGKTCGACHDRFKALEKE